MSAYPPFWRWLGEKLGSPKWCVAARMTDNLRRRGHEVSVTPKRYAALRAQYIEEHPRFVAVKTLPPDFAHREWLIEAARKFLDSEAY